MYHFGRSSNGRTTGSGPVYLGSSPSLPALRQAQCLARHMKYFLYILLCNQKTYYVGVTNNLDKRLHQHKSGESQFTSQFSDIQLVYFEEYPTLVLARRRETQLKGWSHAKKEKYILEKVSKNRH